MISFIFILICEVFFIYLSVQLEVDIVVFVKGELVTTECVAGGGEEQEIIEKKPNKFLLWFSFLQNPTVKKPKFKGLEITIGDNIFTDLLGPTELVRELKVIFSCRFFSSVWRSTWICSHSSLSEFSFILIPSFTCHTK